MNEIATFGNGCFWCTEAIFQSLKGVKDVMSGYSGGNVQNPTYEQVCSGTTGHAEVIQVTYDSAIISYEVLLQLFFATHDPTTLNRQGNDVGTQYRSSIFYHNENQKLSAEKVLTELDDSEEWSDPIVTEIVPYKRYYEAGNYHKNYFMLNGSEPYCSFLIKPKLDKFREKFGDLMK